MPRASFRKSAPFLLVAVVGLFVVGVGALLVAGSAEEGPPETSEHATSKPAPTAEAEEERFTRIRQQMVTRQIEARGLKDENILRVMRTVPRQLFVPPELREAAYLDGPLPIGYGQTISQPYVVALMTQLLEVKPEHRVLEVGTGSGYQAAILAELVKEVYTIEIIPALGQSAQKRLADLDYRNVTCKTGDGYFGWPDKAPFDGIVVTAATTVIPPPLLEQLKPTGRMVIPVGSPDQVQLLKLVSKNPTGPPTVRTVERVRFVPLLRNR